MPVDIKHLKECLAEAERFVKRATVCLEEIEVIVAHNAKTGLKGWPDQRKSAATRRASMDLTRALANLRKT
jgi:hypothetical protein